VVNICIVDHVRNVAVVIGPTENHRHVVNVVVVLIQVQVGAHVANVVLVLIQVQDGVHVVHVKLVIGHRKVQVHVVNVQQVHHVQVNVILVVIVHVWSNMVGLQLYRVIGHQSNVQQVNIPPMDI